VEVIHGALYQRVGIPPSGLVVGRSEDEIRRVFPGLDAEAILLLQAPSVSKVHCRIFWSGDDLLAEDGYLNDKYEHVRSSNQVRRNGQAFLQALLEDGDELVVGDVVLRVGVLGIGYGMSATELPVDALSTLKPTARRHDTDGPPVLTPLVEAFFHAVDLHDLGNRLALAARSQVGASRSAVIEFGPSHERFRVLGMAGEKSPRFISGTVLGQCRANGLTLHRSGAKDGPAAHSFMMSSTGSAVAAPIRTCSSRPRMVYVDTFHNVPHLTWQHALQVQALAAHAGAAFDALETQRQVAEQRLKFDKLRKYFASNVVDHLLKHPEEILEKPQVVEATVLFADLSGYTALAEAMADSLPELVIVLGQWLDRASRVVFAHGGTLDKFIGDAVMAVFGAPFPLPDAALRAVSCAVGMRQVIGEISKELGIDLSITVGINTGQMVAGSVGSPKRLEFTVLGDAVNVASRLQSAAQRGEILVGQSTAQQLGGAIAVEAVGPLSVKNRLNPIPTFRVLG